MTTSTVSSCVVNGKLGLVLRARFFRFDTKRFAKKQGTFMKLPAKFSIGAKAALRETIFRQRRPRVPFSDIQAFGQPFPVYEVLHGFSRDADSHIGDADHPVDDRDPIRLPRIGG